MGIWQIVTNKGVLSQANMVGVCGTKKARQMRLAMMSDRAADQGSTLGAIALVARQAKRIMWGGFGPAAVVQRSSA